jgi:hypothetical protein
MRFRFRPTAYAGRAVPPESDHAFKPSRCGVLNRQHPCHDGWFAHAVFSASRFRMRSLCLLETPSVGSFVIALPSAHVPGPQSDCSRGLTGSLSGSGNARGILITLFAVLLPPAGGGVFRRLGPTCRFAICPPRVSSSRGLSTIRASCIGFWGLAPQTSRAVRSIGPARAFVHRAESDSPAMTALSFDPFSGLILRPPASTSGAYPPMGFSRLATANLQCFATTSRVPFGVLRGRRLADPAVFPPDQHSRPRFFRRP